MTSALEYCAEHCQQALVLFSSSAKNENESDPLNKTVIVVALLAITILPLLRRYFPTEQNAFRNLRVRNPIFYQAGRIACKTFFLIAMVAFAASLFHYSGLKLQNFISLSSKKLTYLDDCMVNCIQARERELD